MFAPPLFCVVTQWLGMAVYSLSICFGYVSLRSNLNEAMYSNSSSWNSLRNDLKLDKLVCLDQFKPLMKDLVTVRQFLNRSLAHDLLTGLILDYCLAE